MKKTLTMHFLLYIYATILSTLFVGGRALEKREELSSGGIKGIVVSTAGKAPASSLEENHLRGNRQRRLDARNNINVLCEGDHSSKMHDSGLLRSHGASSTETNTNKASSDKTNQKYENSANIGTGFALSYDSKPQPRQLEGVLACGETLPILRYGSPEAWEVIRLQRTLNAKNDAALCPDGNFGPNTKEAVEIWQQQNDLSVTGEVDKLTWDTLCGDNGLTISSMQVVDPFQCTGTEGMPAKSYLSRIKTAAFNSGHKTYEDLAVEIGEFMGVNPALLAAHMVRESSLGINNKCIERAGKTALTGCGWPINCARDCSCDTWAVNSDRDQLRCSANVDLNADDGLCAYEKCDRPEYDEETRQKCNLCVYQGNYDKDLTVGPYEDGDPRYSGGSTSKAESIQSPMEFQ